MGHTPKARTRHASSSLMVDWWSNWGGEMEASEAFFAQWEKANALFKHTIICINSMAGKGMGES